MLAVVDLDAADVAILVGKHDHALEARAARPHRRVGERDQHAGVGQAGAGERGADADAELEIVAQLVAGRAERLERRDALRLGPVAGHREPEDRLGADAQPAAQPEVRHAGRQLQLAADGVAGRSDAGRQGRGLAGEERRVDRPPEVLAREAAEREPPHAARGGVTGELVLDADRDPQVAGGADRQGRVGLAEEADAHAEPRIARGRAARADAGELGAALGKHDRQAEREPDPVEQRAGQRQVAGLVVRDRRGRRHRVARRVAQLGGEQVVRVVERQRGREPPRRRVPRRLDDRERIARGRRLEPIELVAHRLGARRPPRDEAGEQPGRERPAQTRNARRHCYSSTETTNVVPRTPSTVRGVLIWTDPGCWRVSSPERTIMVPFLSLASMLPLRFFGSKK